MEITKKSKLNGELKIREIPYEVSKKMIIKNHYSKKWNTSFGKFNFGIFKDDTLLGCAVFGNLMNPASYGSITDKGKDSIVELNRLWVDDILGKNTETIFMSGCFSLIKQLKPNIKYIQSFADGRLGCGTIYKASNFKYYGYSESLFFKDLDTGEVFHKVPLENTKRPLGFLNKNRRYLDDKLEAFTVKTYRYIYQLYKKCRDIKLKELPYPEYNKGFTKIIHTHSDSLLVRLSIMYDLIDDIEYSDKAIAKLKNKTELNNVRKVQLENKSVQWFYEKYLIDKKNISDLCQNRI